MDSLDISTHQFILDDLATNIASSILHKDADVKPDDWKLLQAGASAAGASKHKGQKYLSTSAALSQMSLARFASSIASASHSSAHAIDEANDQHLSDVLVELVKFTSDLSSQDVEPSMAFQDWPLADQLAYALPRSLLQVAAKAPQHRAQCVDAIVIFATDLATALGAPSGDAHAVVTRLVPMLHGLYRALSSSMFAWNLSEYARLVAGLAPLTGTSQIVQRLNQVLLVLPEQQAALAQGARATRRRPKNATVRAKEDEEDGRSEGSVDTFFSGDEGEADELVIGGFTYQDGQDLADDESFSYRFAILSHYRRLNRSLSGHLVLCAALEILGSVLAQSLASFAKPPIESFADYQKMALDQKAIDPARAPRPDRFDVDAMQNDWSKSADSKTTRKAWASLYRYKVDLNAQSNSLSNGAPANGQAVNGGGGLLNAIPLIGGANKGSSAFPETVSGAGSLSRSELSKGVASSLHLSSRAYHDIQRFIENEGQRQGQLFSDVYSLEILSESLKLGALSSIALSILSDSQIDAHVVVRIRALLSESAVVIDPILQTAALQSAGVLVRNFPALVGSLTTQLRRFVASPQPMFVSDGIHVSPVLISAAKCLANCVTMTEGDDLAVSTMYALLNHLGRDAHASGAGGAAAGTQSLRSRVTRGGAGAGLNKRDFSMTHSSSQQIFAARNDDEKRLVQLSVITIVSRLALEINRKEVTGLTISMLLQRLRNADADGEITIINNLVPLALAGPKGAFVDVIRALSQVSRNAISGGAERRAGDAIHAAQLRLARGLGALRESADLNSVTGSGEEDDDEDGDRYAGQGRKELYLIELLQQFSEKGQALQATASVSGGSRSEQSELSQDLASLLPSIAAVLSHKDLNPEVEPSLEMVSLFRNLWFLSVIFGFAGPQAAPYETEALKTISVKTPTLVPETSHNYLETDLQYNSVLRRDLSGSALDAQRQTLEKLIPGHAGQIKSFGFPQITFLTSIYHLECMRSSMGRPSGVIMYFVNEGLNKSTLVGSMEAIADRVIASYISDLTPRVSSHTIDPRVSLEIRRLLLGSCHRVEKARSVSRKFVDRLFAVFSSLACDQDVVFAMLEILTLLRRACEGQYRDQFSPVYHFRSERVDVEFELSDSYSQREEILSQFLQRTRYFLRLTMDRAPIELQSILHRYLGIVDDDSLPLASELGKSVALEFARALPTYGATDVFLPPLGGWQADASSSFVGELSSKSTYSGEMTGIHLALAKSLVDLKKDPESNFSDSSVQEHKAQLAKETENLMLGKARMTLGELRRILYRSASLAVALPKPDFDLLHHIVAIPCRFFTPQAIQVGSHVWTWIIGERPETETKIMVELSIQWGATVKARKGIFQDHFTVKHALLQKTEMTAYDRKEVLKERERADKLFSPHLTLIQLFSSRFQAFRLRDPTMVLALVRMLQRSAAALKHMTTHPLARQARFALILFGFKLIQSSRLDALIEHKLRMSMYNMGFQWFSSTPQFSHGSDRLQTAAEMATLKELLEVLKVDSARSATVVTSFIGPSALSTVRLAGYLTLQDAAQEAADRRVVLQLLVEDELRRLSVWSNPLGDTTRGGDFSGSLAGSMTDAKWASMISLVWRINPDVAVQLPIRFKSSAATQEVAKLVRAEPHKIYQNPDSLSLLTENHLRSAAREGVDLKWLLYWGPVSPVDAICLFQPTFGNNPMLLQYAMRTLEHHPVDLAFFYVPQVVQAVRDDAYGYVEQFIFETSKVSQLFCHQILWNMKANSYQDDDGEVPDPMKPTLDRMTQLIVESLDGEAQDFYDREFGFFNEVTSISGKLKPYIKKSKPEKKAKIDEEMDKIRVDPGVYLPSNPDGVVVDLDRRSGRPLQSHAKAPFMATFKVHRDVPKDDGDESNGNDNNKEKSNGNGNATGMDVWQAAIFKVGDDCRQDVLALQCMAMMKNIYTTIGLDAYLYPYRVTATGPGCGVIDVVANATSRDEMGRSKINSLLDFFVGKYGNVDSITFQKARLNFIQSMAAYSVACHLLQCRDRHNGNIMIVNDTGHLVHIDFGFLFDIGPGGMHFEPYSFKLTEEFIEVMGGIDSQGFKLFCELSTKAFLAVRPYCEQIVEVCTLMMNTGLPSFKGQPTMDRFKGRFMPQLDEREAATHWLKLIKDAAGNRRSIIYDAIQLAQNGIPYK